MSSLIEPDVMLPAQLGALGSIVAHQPERRLMLAVLEDAIQTVMRYAGDRRVRQQKLVREVDRWIDVRNEDDVFAFANVCAVLDLDANVMRKGIRRMMARLEEGRQTRSRLALARRMAGERHRVSLSRAQRRAAAAAAAANAG